MTPRPKKRIHRFRRAMRKFADKLDLGRHVQSLSSLLYRRRARGRLRTAWQKIEKKKQAQASAPAGRGKVETARKTARPALRWLRRHWLGVSTAILLAVSLAGVGPVWRRFRVWKVDRLIESAAESLQRQEWQAAYEKSGAALLMRNSDPTAVRILFAAMRKTGNANIVEVAYWLMGVQDLTPDEKFSVVEVLADQAPDAAFLGAMIKLTPEEKASARYLGLHARVLIRRGEYPVAASLLQMISEEDQTPLIKVETARLLCRRNSGDDIAKARALFLELKQGGHAEALQVFRLLAGVPGGLRPDSAEGFPLLERWISDEKEHTDEDRLAAIDQRIEGGESVVALAREVVTRFGSSNPGAAGEWLNRHVRYQEAIALLSAPAKSNPRAFAALVEAQVGLGSREEAERTIANPPTGVDKVDLELLRIKLTALAGTELLESAVWQAAVKAADSDVRENRGLELAALAESLGKKQEAESAMVVGLRHKRGNLPLYRDVGPLVTDLIEQRRVADLLDISRNLVRYEAGNPGLQNNVYYLEALMGEAPPAELLPKMQTLYGQFPDPEIGQSLAFVHLMAGDFAVTIHLMEEIRTAHPEQADSVLFAGILGVALERLGREEEAAPLLSRVPWGTSVLLLEEENALTRIRKS